MFSTIFIHEIKTWFKKPLLYTYAGVLFLLSLLLSATAVGVFDSNNVTVTSSVKLNGAVGIYGLLGIFAILTYLLIPSIIGGTIQRDFKNNMHNVLYSYPLTKINYLLAKFSAGMIMTLLVITASAIGLTLGFYLPGANADLIGPFKIMNYLQPFLLYIIPNVFFYGAIVFAITAFLRNVNVGFMFVLVMVILQFAAQASLPNMDDTFWIEILEPTGDSATYSQIKYWTPEEQSTQLIPVTGTLLYNRLIWLGISLIVFISVLFKFSFSQNPSTLSLIKAKAQRVVKKNFGTIEKIALPKITQNLSFIGQLKTSWIVAKSDISFIVKGWPFIIIASVAFSFSLLTMLITGQQYGTAILPKTWVMLQFAGGIFSTFAYLLIYLYAGLILNRAKAAHIDQLVDTTPTKNWTLLFSKFITMVVMIATLLLIVILSGIIIQTYNGFFEFELPLYVFDLYIINIWDFIPWILMSLLIHTLIKNKWLGLITLLILAIGIPPLLNAIGVEQSQFIFNQGAGSPSPSDMNGYGSGLPRYFTYRLYWTLLGVVLFVFAIMFFRRGMGSNIKERFAFAKARFTKPLIGVFALCLLGFFAIGGYIWKVNNIDNKRTTGKEREELAVNFEKELGKFNKAPQPRLVAVNTFMHIFPETRDYKAGATFTLVNQTEVVIDTLHVNYPNRPNTVEFDRVIEIVYDHEDYDYRMYQFDKPLQPGDTLVMKISTQNKPNTFFDNNSPVVDNGTFINNGIFPSIGYNEQGELRNPQVRKKYHLPLKDRLPAPDVPGARDNNYIGGNSDWIDFEATVSTSNDQIAIAPGYLIKEWEQEGRKYFHYKMDSKILNFYAFLSGRYEVKREEHEGIKLEIYYHPDHDYNIDRMMNGLRDGLDYFNGNYTPYQHRQARIIEFPRTGGGFAQAFPNTIPFSEAIGFIADVDDEDKDAVDYPFSITAHELAHQWWAHQVIGANAKGATLLSESLSEYSSLKVLEKINGKSQMRKFLKDAMDGYLLGRTVEQIKENPLMYNENQQYIHYQKGSLVLYAMSDYIGEKKFNNVVKRFAEKYQFKGAPYPVSTEFVADIKAVTPDSLQYVIKDMFETITLYRNRIVNTSSKALDNGKYEVEIEFEVSKYRNDDKGKRYYGETVGDTLSYQTESMKRPILSVVLSDYIELGVFGEDEEELYLKKYHITEINNKIKIIVDKAPKEVGVDPYNKLIDTNSNDNRRVL
jgi:ABC-2 type transport system permease protein